MADKKIKLLVVYSDRTGVGKFRSIGPHSYIQKHYSDDFDIDIVGINDIPSEGLESFLKKYDFEFYTPIFYIPRGYQIFLHIF